MRRESNFSLTAEASLVCPTCRLHLQEDGFSCSQLEVSFEHTPSWTLRPDRRYSFPKTASKVPAAAMERRSPCTGPRLFPADTSASGSGGRSERCSTIHAFRSHNAAWACAEVHAITRGSLQQWPMLRQIHETPYRSQPQGPRPGLRSLGTGGHLLHLPPRSSPSSWPSSSPTSAGASSTI